MVQLQILSRVLTSKDISIIGANNLTEEYFSEYREEYLFIKSHFEKYRIVPDIETFISNFPDIEIIDVRDSDRYLVDTIREEYLYSKTVPVIKQAAKLLKADANEASRYLQSELVNLTPNYSTPFVDIVHSKNRVSVFDDKSKNKSNWFIPTGFEELDDIVCGWQAGEEFIVLFARTGQGKSWILVKSMEHAWKIGKNVGYVSPEMSPDKIGYRFDTMHQHLSNTALVRGDTSILSTEEYSSYFDKLSESENSFLVSTPRDFDNKITVTKLRTFVTENKLDVLAVDGITYLSDERGSRNDNKTTSLTHISEDLMQLSCELKIPVLVVVQSNRGGVDKDTPDLEDIRDSDGISYNATKVISLKQKGDGLLMTIKKNRDGRVGDKICYLWDIDTGTFNYVESLDEHDTDNYEELAEKREQRNENKPKPEQKKVVF